MIDRPFPDSESAVEARVEPRKTVGWRGQLVTEDGGRFSVRIIDISATGAGVVGDDKLAAEPVILEARVPRLPAMGRFSVQRWRATVAYQTLRNRELRSGLEFQDLTLDDEALLRAWVERHTNPR